VPEIYLVGNRATFGTRVRAMADVPATWILNPTEDLTQSGSAHSWGIAIDSVHQILDGRSRVVLMDADILYGAGMFELLSREDESCSKTLVSPDYEPSDEEVLVFSEPGRPRAPRTHGKGLLCTPLVESLVCVGEATGVVVWEPGDHRLVRAATDWALRYSTAKLRSEHEDVTEQMMLLGRMASVLLPAGFPFIEVDSPDDYQRMIALHARLVGHDGCCQ
jgi:choline kinase